jgi:imidazolonepropionase-like amidohydrolase
MLALLLASLALQAPSRSAGDTLAIEHATVLPMERDTALADHTILVVGDRIAWIGPALAATVPRGARRVDARGRFVIPGLADMHVHIEDAADLPEYVAAGVTTIRNMRGGAHYLVWRERVAAGAMLGPTIFTSGPTVVGSRRWNPEFVRVTSVEDAGRVASQQARSGYDMIKVHSGLTVAAYERLAQVARQANVPVVGHVLPEVGIGRTLRAGQASLEHADLSLFDGDRNRLDEWAAAIARSGAYVGTISLRGGRRCEPPSDEQRNIIAALRRANVRLLAGTDASLEPVRPGTSLYCELETLVRAGLTPYEALVTATRNASEFARAHLKERVPFGVVAVGARADLVVLAADPRRDIRAVARPIGTVLRGVWRSRQAAD